MRKYILLSLMCVTLCAQAQNISTLSSEYVRTDIPENELRQARLLYDEGNYEMAEVILRKIATSPSVCSQKREAERLLTLIAFHRDATKAGDAIERYLYAYPAAPDVNRMKALAMLCNYAQGNYAAVIEDMQEVDPDQLSHEERDEVILAYAMAMMEEERYDEAAVQWRILDIISEKYDDEVTFYTAYIDFINRKYDTAQEGMEEMIDNAHFHRQARRYLAEIALETREYAKSEALAVAYIEEYGATEPVTELKRIQGEALYAQGRYLSAAIVLEEYLAEADEPKREVLYQLGMSHFGSQEYLRAPEVLAMVGNDNDEIAQSAQLHSGLAYLKLGDKNKARLCFEQAAAMTANRRLRERAMYNYTVCVHETAYSGFGEAVEALEKFLNEFPHSEYSDRVNSYLVETYMNTRNYESALQSIAKIQKPSRMVLEAKQCLLYKSGTEAFANSDVDKAIAKLSESLNVGDYDRQTRADTYFWRGEAYYRKGNYRQATKDYTQYFNLTNERSDRIYALALYGQGYAHFVQQKYQDAFKQFNLLQQKYSSSSQAIDNTTLADAQMRIGDCYFYSRKYNSAEDAYEKAISLDASVADYAIYQKGFTQGLTGRYSDKIGTLTYLVENYPQSDYIDDALYEKGRAYVQLDKGEQAIQTFEQLTENYPQSQYASKAGNEIALIYYQNDNIQSAIKAYKRVITNYPGSEQANLAMRDLKNLYVEENMVDSYVEFASQTLGMVTVEVNEHDSLAYKAAELAYVRGEEKKAIESFAKYLEQFKTGAYVNDAQYYMGCIYHKQNNPKQALHYLQLVAGRNSKYKEEATRMVADLAYDQKDYMLAQEAYGELINISNSPSTKLHAQIQLLRAAQRVGNYSLIITETGEVLNNSKLAPETAVELRYYRAKAYLATGKKESAIEDLVVLSKDTRNVYGAEAKYLLGQLYYDLQQYDKAEQLVLDYISVSTPHSYWLARSFVLLSDVYVKKERVIEAKQYLLSLKQSYQAKDDIASMIETRLNALNTDNNQ